MEACNIVLIFVTLLFSIKGQTVQNSTVIPPTLCVHTFLPQCLIHTCNCTVFTSKVINTGVLIVFYVLQEALTLPLLLSSPETANQKAAPGAGRLSGEGGDPDVSAVCQCEFVYLKKTPSKNSRLICMITCCQRAFTGSVAYRSSGRNTNLWDAH